MEKKFNILEKIIKYNFKKKTLLEKAVTHKSFNNNINNEKLEFLGDRVLGLTISEILLEKYPDEKEGVIDKKFANLVNKKTCSLIAKKIDLKKFKVLPKYIFSKKTGPQHRPLFKTEVQIPNSKKVIGIGSSKKNAQQDAANKLLKYLDI